MDVNGLAAQPSWEGARGAGAAAAAAQLTLSCWGVAAPLLGPARRGWLTGLSCPDTRLPRPHPPARRSLEFVVSLQTLELSFARVLSSDSPGTAAAECHVGPLVGRSVRERSPARGLLMGTITSPSQFIPAVTEQQNLEKMEGRCKELRRQTLNNSHLGYFQGWDGGRGEDVLLEDATRPPEALS
ncbi:uncharacterized protein LOC114036788 isoform X2 [Vombatus ursinus]|uniref:uncharacterized protein LOC114036788 isoform X2 n=1 Tax=Vombatus ursinus TaxID=29139 RepID=UPI000FFD663B|nr:uncharacterized protein LOC114036788 isoform X2 [Vombatus ursinus]